MEARLTLSDVHATLLENGREIRVLESNYAKIDRKLDRLIFWMLSACASFTASLLLFVFKLLAAAK